MGLSSPKPHDFLFQLLNGEKEHYNCGDNNFIGSSFHHVCIQVKQISVVNLMSFEWICKHPSNLNL